MRSFHRSLTALWMMAAATIPAASQTQNTKGQNTREFEFLYPADTICIPGTHHLKLQVFDKKERDASAVTRTPTPYYVGIAEATIYPLISATISDAFVITYVAGIAQKVTSYT